MGLLFSVFAIASQDGWARGYTTIFLLFVSVILAVLGLIAGVVTLALGKFGTAFELIASSIILPATFLLIFFAVKIFNGE